MADDSSKPPDRPQLSVVPSVEEVEETSEFGIYGADEIFRQAAPRVYVCGPLGITQKSLTMLVGPSSAGKTFVAQSYALSVVTGKPFLGHFPVKQGRVLHLDYEQDEEHTQERYHRLARAMGIDANDLHDRLFIISPPRFHLDTADGLRALEALCKNRRIDDLIVDSFRVACPHTDENSSKAREPIDNLRHKVIVPLGMHSQILHHTGKTGKDPRAVRDMVRGTSAFRDAYDTVLVMDADADDENLSKVIHDKTRRLPKKHVPFYITREDVDGDGDIVDPSIIPVECIPALNLRLVFHATPPDAPAVDDVVTDPVGKIEKQIIAFLSGQPGCEFVGGLDAFAKVLGCHRRRIKPALASLERKGCVVKGGDYHRPSFILRAEVDELE